MRTSQPALARDLAALPPRALQPEAARRTLNVAAAVVGIVLTAPLLPLIALLVRTTSRGPILYGQPRIGLNRRRQSGPVDRDRRRYDLGGAPFTIYKFRTMHVRPAHLEAATWATPGDIRVTPVGRVLRKFRLDEIPQLFNVVLGEMNVVGPRPEQPAIFAALRREIRGYAERQTVRPGITGLAQVTLDYDTTLAGVQRKVAADLAYIARCSAVEDLKVMARTVWVMLRGRGGW